MRGWALSAAFTLAAGALALPASPARPQSLADTARVRRWREDLAFVVDRVTTVHPRPFAFSSRAAFDSAAAAIGQRIATTDDAGLAADCMRLVASLGDGHTILIGTFPALGFDAVLPLWLRPCEDGLYVGAAGPPFARAAGAKVVSIGGVAADQALERVLAITSGDNRYTRLDRAPLFLMMPALLKTLGLAAARDRVTIEIERPDGKREQLAVSGGRPPAGYPDAFLESEPRVPAGWTGARRFPSGGPPRCDLNEADAWWLEYLQEYRVLYLRMRRVDAVSGKLAYFEFFRKLFRMMDELKPRAFVIDLRHDHGGNNSILDPLIRGIVERPWIDRDGALFAIVDRGTFSAAMNAAVFLDNQTRVTFVGEPTGGRVNHYGDAPELHTPNLRLLLQVSTVPWMSRFPTDERKWITPDLAVRSTFADWSDGRDRALEAVIDVVLRGSLGSRILEAARANGLQAGAEARDAWRRQYPNPWNEGLERRPLRLAGDLMDSGQAAEAATLCEVLVGLDPGSYLAWRTLGEALIAREDNAHAADALRHALEINPHGETARMMLERLGEKP